MKFFIKIPKFGSKIRAINITAEKIIDKITINISLPRDSLTENNPTIRKINPIMIYNIIRFGIAVVL